MTQEPAAPPAQPLRQAAERLREAARWLVVTFGAVAAVVFAGISFSRFGDLDPHTAPRLFTLAACGAVVALAGILWALLEAMSLSAASAVSVADLLAAKPARDVQAALNALSRDPLLAPWAYALKDFFDSVGEAQRDYQRQLSAWGQSTDMAFGSDFLVRASQRLETLSQIQGRILETASYLRLRQRFQNARWRLAGGLLLAAAGAAAYVWATGPAAIEHIPKEASRGIWTVPLDDRHQIKDRISEGACTHDLAAVPVTILDEQSDGSEADIVTAASDECRPLRVVVNSDQLKRSD